MTINGKPVAIEKVDAVHRAARRRPTRTSLLPDVLASVWGIGHHARFGRGRLGGFAPRALPEAVPPEVRLQGRTRQELAEDCKFDNWVTALQEPERLLRATSTCRS